jgi:hypothetical protein
MNKNSFETQFPGYKIIPEKKSRWAWPMVWLSFILLIAGGPILLFKFLTYNVPTPSSVGNSEFTLPTLQRLAMDQFSAGQHSVVVQTLEKYFALGGVEADMMAVYAQSLSEIGRTAEAKVWSQKAIAADPKSKAAKLVHDNLEHK